MKRILGLLLVGILAGCSDGPTAVEEPTSVEIHLGTSPVSEQTLEVGQTVQLTAVVVGATGGAAVEWRSEAPQIAEVSAGGMLTGVSVGSTRVIASVGRVADTVRVIVTQPPPAELTCGESVPRLQLAVGEVHTATGPASIFCLDSGPAGAEYTVIPLNASTTGTLKLEVLGGGIVAPVLPLHPSVDQHASPLLSRSPSAAVGAAEDADFHARLREQERILLGGRAAAGIRGPSFSVAGETRVPAVGEVLQLNVATAACTSPVWRSARVEAVGSRGVMVADLSNPEGGFTSADYQQFAQEFDALVWPVSTRNFGEPSDIDQNARVIVLFTRAVNELTEPGSGSFVGGFYHPRDLLPRNECAGSNAAEVLYQLVPDPARATANNENFLLRDEVRRRTVAVIAHELQHLISASRRVLMIGAPLEEVWLNEAMSHIAEELVFFEDAGLGPHMNIDIQRLRSSSRILTAVNRHQVSNLGRMLSYIQSPGQFDFRDGNDIVTRGGAWAFLRYAADRQAPAATQQTIWHSLVNSRSTGINNLAAVFNTPPFDLMGDWTVSVFADDAGLPVEPRFQQPSWNFRSVLPNLLQEPRWPLQVRVLENNQSAEFTLLPGGTQYLRLALSPGTPGGVRVTSNRVPPPQALRLSIMRTR